LAPAPPPPALTRQAGYVLVEEVKVGGGSGGGVDTPVPAPTKTSNESPAIMKLRSALASGGKSLPPITAWLTLYGGVNSGNGTALTQVQPLQPTSFNEWSDLAALYEECKVEMADVNFMVTPIGTSPSSEIGGICYSPTVDSALSGADQAYEFSQSDLFAVGIQGVTLPTPVTKTGLYRFQCTVPKGSVRSAGAADLFGSEWSATADASDAYGYLKWYVPALGAAASSNLKYVIKMKVHFRSRQ